MSNLKRSRLVLSAVSFAICLTLTASGSAAAGQAAATRRDGQGLVPQYVRYTRAFNRKDADTLRQLLTPGCAVDVPVLYRLRYKKTTTTPQVYFQWEMARSQILKLKVLKITLRGDTTEVLVQEDNWQTGGPPTDEISRREDSWFRTPAGWRIGHIHEGVSVGLVD